MNIKCTKSGAGLLLLILSLQSAAAFYDPGLQGWINRDPIGENGGLNLFSFVRNAPSGWVDPLGLNNICVHENCKGIDLSGHTYLAELEPNHGPGVLRLLPEPGKCVDADAIHVPGAAYKIGDFATVDIDCKDAKPTLVWGGIGSSGNRACWRFGEPNPPIPNWPHMDRPITPYKDKPPVKPSPPLHPFPAPGNPIQYPAYPPIRPIT